MQVGKVMPLPVAYNYFKLMVNQIISTATYSAIPTHLQYLSQHIVHDNNEKFCVLKLKLIF